MTNDVPRPVSRQVARQEPLLKPKQIRRVRELLMEPVDIDRPTPFVSPRQVADYVRHSPEWVWRQIRAGRLRGLTVGRVWRAADCLGGL